MKKIFAVLLIAAVSVSLIACGKGIGAEQALNIAINQIGISEDQIAVKEVEFENKLFGSEYEVEVKTIDGDEYEFIIKAADGEITAGTAAVANFDTSLIAPETPAVADTNAESAPTSDSITIDEALNIAIVDAAVEESSIIEKQVELEKGINGEYYEVDFETITTEYEYVISITTGEILSSKTEPNT